MLILLLYFWISKMLNLIFVKNDCIGGFCIILVSKILNLICVKNYENFLVSKVLNVIFV